MRNKGFRAANEWEQHLVDWWRRFLVSTASAIAVAATVVSAASSGVAAGPRDEFRATLSDPDRKSFDAHVAALLFHDAALDAYWSHVDKKRESRRTRKRQRQVLTAADYVLDQPPAFTGPALAPHLAKRWQAFQKEREQVDPPPAREAIATVDDFVENARRHYGFVAERISERAFKERYAREARALGISGDQVVRVYALETGGLGTADMQAGIHPISKKGIPISTALGYAQLLAANSINELSRHGAGFVGRLRALAAREVPGSDRQRRLVAKSKALERMVKKARAIPYVWSRHVAFSKTDVGGGIHAINLDGDIGPWLQVIKLKGLKETAAKAGRDRLTGAEIELMNLAGPGTGLEMMEPAGRGVPTTNFFARAAYYRNTIVRGKTSAELLKALDERMEANLKNAGSIEFREVFRRIEAPARVAQ